MWTVQTRSTWASRSGASPRPCSPAAVREADQRAAAQAVARAAPRCRRYGPRGFVDDVPKALYASKVVAYAQGFDLIQRAARSTAGTSTRQDREDLARRMHHPRSSSTASPSVRRDPNSRPCSSRRTSGRPSGGGGQLAPGVATPPRRRAGAGFGSSLSYFDGLRSDRLPAALLQGQRDFFGAHTYRRVDREGVFHTLWSEDRSEIPA